MPGTWRLERRPPVLGILVEYLWLYWHRDGTGQRRRSLAVLGSAAWIIAQS